MLTSLPASICSSAWRSTLEPANWGSKTAPVPKAAPIARPGTPNAAPAVEPALAPAYIDARFAPWPAKARGTCDTASPAADSKPLSRYAFLTASRLTPSPASLPMSSLRATPALAAPTGSKILPIPVRAEDISCLPPRTSSLPIVDCLGALPASGYCAITASATSASLAPGGPSI